MVGQASTENASLLDKIGIFPFPGPDASDYPPKGNFGGAYFFTASTSFANPAVTIARTLSDTFAGIRPSSVPAFLVAQLVGAVVAVAAVAALYPTIHDVAHEVVVPHEEGRVRA